MTETPQTDPAARPPKSGRRLSPLRGALVLTSGSGVNFVVKFLRQVLLARLLTVADFGVVGTLMAAMSLLDTISNFNFQLLVVQDKRGNDLDYGAAIKGLSVARQVFIALLMLIFAGPIALLMDQPDMEWAYRCLALLPLFSAFNHQDLVRMNRQLRFGPQLLNTLGGEVTALILIVPLVLIFGDYRALLVVLILQGLVKMVGSHLQAEYPFRVRWDWDVAKQGLRFGWPMMLAGIVLFGVFQGDRILVANFYSPDTLGLIAAVLSMVIAPVSFTTSQVRQYFLPILARHQDNQAAFDDRSAFAQQATLCAALLAALGFAILGPHVLVLVYGARYAEAGAYITPLGIGFAMQMMRGGTATIAIARSNTLNMLLSNAVRLVFFAPAALLATTGADLVTVLFVGAVGQLVGVVVSIVLLYARTGLDNVAVMLRPYLAGGACLAALTVAALEPDYGYATPGVALGVSLLAFAATIWFSGTMLSHLRTRLLGPALQQLARFRARLSRD